MGDDVSQSRLSDVAWILWRLFFIFGIDFDRSLGGKGTTVKNLFLLLTVWVLFKDGTLWEFKNGNAFDWHGSYVMIGKQRSELYDEIKSKDELATFDSSIHKGVKVISLEEIQVDRSPSRGETIRLSNPPKKTYLKKITQPETRP